ncbi:hypothetical protein FJZ31_11335 [Candidatus Poribacteria bacterium]|nr:hypothetical protein [Candidatus Poribacteria bacterium]
MYSPEKSPVRVNPALRHPDEHFMCLDGTWQFRLDADNVGVEQRWFEKPEMLKDTIRVPGCWQGQGYGNDELDEIWDFKIKARIYQATYQGTAWYGYNFHVPEDWRNLPPSQERNNRRVWLNFGGVHPSADVFLNGLQIGSHSGPFVPFGYDVTRHIHFNEDNFLAVRVHERDRYLGFAYNWHGCWSGLYRSVELSATGSSWIEHCFLHPNLEREKLYLQIQVKHASIPSEPLSLAISISNASASTVQESPQFRHEQPVEVVSNTTFLNLSVPVPEAKPWSPDNPHLYRVDVSLRRNEETLDALSERVGFVSFSISGKQIMINDEPYYLRGAGGEFNVAPDTGSPNPSRENWVKRLQLARSYGFNYVRFQSSVPCPEYFDAADEVGLIVQSEMGMLGAWHGHGRAIAYAYPWPTPEFYSALKWQWEKTVMRDANHPSAAIYCLSNEMGDLSGFKKTSGFPDYAKEVAEECYHTTKAIHPASLIIWTDGGYNPELPADFCNAEASQGEKVPLPIIQHEFRWWTSYPDVRIKDKFTGAIRPYFIEIAEQNAAKSGILELLPLGAANSQRLQALERKGKLEALRRDYPHLAGISLFSASDCGPACQGLWDDFWHPKCVSAEEFLKTNGDAVVLIDRNFEDRILVGGEKFNCKFYLSDFSHPPLAPPSLSWEFLINGDVTDSGEIESKPNPFCTTQIGSIDITLPSYSQPHTAVLRAMVVDGRRSISNEWKFWLYPARITFPPNTALYKVGNETLWQEIGNGLKTISKAEISGVENQVLVSDVLDEDVISYIASGGRLVLINPKNIPRQEFKPGFGSAGGYFFTKPAQYPPYEDGNCGTLIQNHVMLSNFPHEDFADLQFYRMIAETPPFDMELFTPYGIVPVIQAFGSPYTVCSQRAYLFETAVGKGRIIFCGLKIEPQNAAAVYLLSVLLKYAASPAFCPTKEIPLDILRDIRSPQKVSE